MRSVQLTSINALGYSDLTPEIMSKGTSIASVAQQLSMSLGVAIGATLLAMNVGAVGHMSAATFRPVFLMIGALPVLAIFGFLTLAPEDRRPCHGGIASDTHSHGRRQADGADSQSSARNPSTRWNSPKFPVTTMKPRLRACPAIIRS